MEKEKKFPNMSDPQKPSSNVRKKKRKKLLQTPSNIIRICMIWVYVIAIYFLTYPLVTTTLYIKDDLSIGMDLSAASMTYASQQEIDKAADDLEEALNSLKPSGDKTEKYEDSMALPSASFDWKYHVANGIDTKRIFSLIEKSKGLDRLAYTADTIKAVNDATLVAQHKLCALVTVSQSALQIVLGGMLNDVPKDEMSSIIISGFVMYVFVLMPVVGVFIVTFAKKGHLKNIYAVISAIVCIGIIFVVVYPSIGIGAVLSVFAYIVLFCLSAAGIYAKQQEDYIVNHPECEAEFTEKHPHFVKALINSKSVTLNETIKKEERIKEAEEKTKSKKKKRKK